MRLSNIFVNISIWAIKAVSPSIICIAVVFLWVSLSDDHIDWFFAIFSYSSKCSMYGHVHYWSSYWRVSTVTVLKMKTWIEKVDLSLFWNVKLGHFFPILLGISWDPFVWKCIVFLILWTQDDGKNFIVNFCTISFYKIMFPRAREYNQCLTLSFKVWRNRYIWKALTNISS